MVAFGHISTIAATQEHYHELDFSNLAKLEERLLLAALAIDESTPEINALHLERSQNRGNLWRIRFVGSLSGTWWRLTGSDPSTTGPFLEFVNAGWASLWADNPSEVSWESAIKTARRGMKESWRDDPGYSRHPPSGD